MSEFVVRLEYRDGRIKEIKSQSRPTKINAGVIKIGKEFFNLAYVDRYLVNGNRPLW
ncbi:hypothetical protein ACIQYS_09885 [Psychrobacillus sp. NPDC096426]|uniref:hypothetical protein n=1 Tax=Psychrobacillus sp. NPDC096426 TaxID=3364491 RepID=UPI0038254E49